MHKRKLGESSTGFSQTCSSPAGSGNDQKPESIRIIVDWIQGPHMKVPLLGSCPLGLPEISTPIHKNLTRRLTLMCCQRNCLKGSTAHAEGLIVTLMVHVQGGWCQQERLPQSPLPSSTPQRSQFVLGAAAHAAVVARPRSPKEFATVLRALQQCSDQHIQPSM